MPADLPGPVDAKGIRMFRTYEVRVYAPSGDLHLSKRLSAPFSIGRGGETDVRIRTDDRMISRHHADVVEQDGTLFVVDRSTNGTEHQGRVLRKERAVLGDDGSFGVRSFRIVVKAAAGSRDEAPTSPAGDRPDGGSGPATLLTASISRRGRGDILHRIGPHAVALLVEDERCIVEGVAPALPDDLEMAYRSAGRIPAALITPLGLRAVLQITDEGRLLGAQLNRAPLGTGMRELASFDVFALGLLRIDFMAPGERGIRCHNPVCTMLNPYDPSLNCRWCGTKLVEGITRFHGGSAR